MAVRSCVRQGWKALPRSTSSGAQTLVARRGVSPARAMWRPRKFPPTAAHASCWPQHVWGCVARTRSGSALLLLAPRCTLLGACDLRREVKGPRNPASGWQRCCCTLCGCVAPPRLFPSGKHCARRWCVPCVALVCSGNDSARLRSHGLPSSPLATRGAKRPGLREDSSITVTQSCLFHGGEQHCLLRVDVAQRPPATAPPARSACGPLVALGRKFLFRIALRAESLVDVVSSCGIREKACLR